MDAQQRLSYCVCPNTDLVGELFMIEGVSCKILTYLLSPARWHGLSWKALSYTEVLVFPTRKRGNKHGIDDYCFDAVLAYCEQSALADVHIPRKSASVDGHIPRTYLCVLSSPTFLHTEWAE